MPSRSPISRCASTAGLRALWASGGPSAARRSDAGALSAAPRIGVSYMSQGAPAVDHAAPSDCEQDPGEVWLQEGLHRMIWVSDAARLWALPTDPYAGGPQVMRHGASHAHVMVPVDRVANQWPAP